MQTVKVSPEIQAISDRAYLYAYGIDENFYLLLRMYGGDEDIQAGKFPVPVVQKVGK